MVIGIEQFKKDIEGKSCLLTLDGESTNNLLSPVSCKLKFTRILVNTIHPASVYVSDDNGNVVILSQINEIRPYMKDGVVIKYILDCGEIAQIKKEYTLWIL